MTDVPSTAEGSASRPAKEIEESTGASNSASEPEEEIEDTLYVTIYQINNLKKDLYQTSGCMKLLGRLILQSKPVDDAYKDIKKVFAKEEAIARPGLRNDINSFDERWKAHKLKIVHTFSNESTLDDAGLFLARVRHGRWLDWTYGNKCVSYFNDNSNVTGLKEHTFINDKEQLTVYKSGSFKHYTDSVGNYSDILQQLQNSGLDMEYLKEFLKSCLRGKNNLTGSLTTQKFLIPIAEFIFDMEVRRNTGSLLTNAMFFDLLLEEGSDYNLQNLISKLPMAMDGAVSASVIIDKSINVLWYDDRNNYGDILQEAKANAKTLARLDSEIVQCWLEWKKKSGNIEAFEVDGKVIRKASRRIFYELIYDWYGIKLEKLNSDNFLDVAQ